MIRYKSYSAVVLNLSDAEDPLLSQPFLFRGPPVSRTVSHVFVKCNTD